MSKFTKLPFTLSESHASEPFELIHMDIWGPYRVCTRGKYRYFLTIVDDHTRSTWIYLLQLKSQSLETLETFLQYAKNHHNKTILYIRSDNALEFDDQPCREFFAKNGIIHQTSCVKRPEQNARVERKHRHILEISRAMRFQVALPLKYWGDCVMTATHIINRLPVEVLNHKTPYKVLHKKEPEYKHLRVLGCLTFASNPDQSGDKFSPRGVSCVFMGYPPTQKGYKLLNLLTMQMFVSRDATFHENVFPFQANTEHNYMKPIPDPKPSDDKPAFDDDWWIVDELEPETPSPTPHTPNNPPQTPPTSPETQSQHAHEPHSTAETHTNSTPPAPRRSTRTLTQPHWMQDYQVNMAAPIVKVATTHINPPFFCFMTTLTEKP